MGNLIAAAVFFLAIHFGVSGTTLRDRLVRVLGEKAYRGLFALTSIGGLIWMINAYAKAPLQPLWGQLLMLKPIAAPLVLLAALLVVLGLSTPSPTTAGMESQLSREINVRGVVRITASFSMGRGVVGARSSRDQRRPCFAASVRFAVRARGRRHGVHR